MIHGCVASVGAWSRDTTCTTRTLGRESRFCEGGSPWMRCTLPWQGYDADTAQGTAVPTMPRIPVLAVCWRCTPVHCYETLPHGMCVPIFLSIPRYMPWVFCPFVRLLRPCVWSSASGVPDASLFLSLTSPHSASSGRAEAYVFMWVTGCMDRVLLQRVRARLGLRGACDVCCAGITR